MRFIFLDTVGIQPDLAILDRTTQPHSLLLYQHTGDLKADPTRIGNNYPVAGQLNAVITKALEENTDLLLTPEYSCPWEIISSIVSTPARWPRARKLWTLGCESITQANLDAFIASNSNPQTYVHFDKSILAKNGSYLDPLVYLFRASYQGVEKLIVVIQFKTHHMGVWTTSIERDHLIQGEEIFILRNAPNSVNLLTLICAEAMNFRHAFQPSADTFQWADLPYLLLNPQLNPDPLHDDFLQFRRYLSEFDKKELISLNWSNASTIHRRPFTRNGTSRSGIYIRSPEADLSHPRIQQNHRQGMYYFDMEHNKHAFILNSRVDAFLIRTMAVSINDGVGPQQRRDGPKVIAAFHFDGTKTSLVISATDIPDYHIDFLTEVGCSCRFLLDPGNSIIEKEMLVSLTTGNVNHGANWYEIENLFSLKSNQQTEPNNRITFIEDDYPPNVDRRNAYVTTFNTIQNHIFANTALFPEAIRDLRPFALKLGYPPDSSAERHRYNVMTDTGALKPATICYLGSASDAEIERKFIELQKMFDYGNMNRCRVVIFYHRNNEIKAKSDPNAGSIGGNSHVDPTSILK